MKLVLMGVAVTALLGACGQVQQRMDLMDVRTVEFPASVAADAPIDIVVELGWGCTPDSPFGQFTATRTAKELKLQAFTRTYTKPATNPPPCPPVYFYGKRTYTDPGTPARSDPFEVIVNGKSYGTVRIQ
ncbi:hypothetical protein [Deinococcus humi]|uniref:Lipoprotein n=1 Tax=Deinococcus humi TaxID=662880 RepID=A0A7W8JPT5_9DEIO|nr:hypothetical protein [Deinococcus humi]MBB5361002.1 hypothetical protein [Deinococcus humi]GGO18013.1 hypothetical protein GCM10008949_00710 [Deinococcus humi]